MDSGLVTFWDGVYFSPFVNLEGRLPELVHQIADGVGSRGVEYLAADLAALAARSGMLVSISNAAPGDQVYIAAEITDPDSGSLPDDFEDHLVEMDHGQKAVVVLVRRDVAPEVLVVTGYQKRANTPPRPL